jgi:glycosyltransferase involved in cell wall biosynthesis
VSDRSAAARVAQVRRNKAILDAVDLARARIFLQRERVARPDIWSGEPLVSVRIPTFERPDLVVERAIASALAQTYRNIEVVVVGDGEGPATARAVEAVGDPRVRYENLRARPRYATFPRFFWSTAGTHAANRALDLARGSWIAPLDDDDTFTPDHVEVLLDAAREQRLEMVHSQMNVLVGSSWTPLGRAPLAKGHVCHGSVLYSARLLGLRYDPLCWVDDDPGDWSLWKRFLALGARIGFVERVLGTHYPEHSSVSPEERRDLATRVASPETFLADLARAGGGHLLSMA